MASVFEKALTMDWVETVMFPYNIVETQGEALMQRCREQNIGFICMKPMAGGALEDARLALRFIRQNENVSVVIPGMYDVREIDQNLEAMEDVSPRSVLPEYLYSPPTVQELMELCEKATDPQSRMTNEEFRFMLLKLASFFQLKSEGASVSIP